MLSENCAVCVLFHQHRDSEHAIYSMTANLSCVWFGLFRRIEMSYQLVEIDQSPSFKPLLANYEANRDKIALTASCSSLPDVVATATTNGFVQVASLSGTSFRLFLVHLEETPLEAPLRLLHVARVGASASEVTHILFALAHDNGLCVGNVNSGEVQRLHSFVSRPSAIFCDGDHTLCGDASGELALWRHSFGFDEPLWTRNVLTTGVSALNVCRDIILVGTADFVVNVLSMQGRLLTTLPCEASPIRNAFAFFSHASFRYLGVVTAEGVLTVWQPAPNDSNSWTPASVLQLEFPSVSSVTISNNFIAIGSETGQVALYDATDANEIRPITCFPLKHAILGATVADDSHFVVVTSGGDVWRWPLKDVLPNGEEETAIVNEQKVEDDHKSHAPQEYDFSSDAPADAAPEPTPDEVIPTPTPRGGSPAAYSQQRPEQSTGSRGQSQTYHQPDAEVDSHDPYHDDRSSDEEADLHDVAVGGTPMDAPFAFEPEDRPQGGPPRAAGGTLPPQHDVDEVIYLEDDFSVQTPHDTQTASSLPQPAGGQRSGSTTTTRERREYDEDEEDEQGDSGSGDAKPRTSTPQPTPQRSKLPFQETSSPNVSVSGLKHGRRMRPEAVEEALKRRAPSPEDMPSDQQTTSMLQHSMAELQRDFDPKEYSETHRSAAQGFAFQHPVPGVKYGIRDQVFDLPKPSQDESVMSPTGDSLLNKTAASFSRKRDPVYEREKNAECPNIDDHLCDDLLMTTNDILLPNQPMIDPPAPSLLLLPLSLAPTPATF